MSFTTTTFECRLYISPRHRLAYALPTELGPKRVARLQAPEYDQLVDPSFRRLLAAFENLRDAQPA
jgi:hypothetical protein